MLSVLICSRTFAAAQRIAAATARRGIDNKVRIAGSGEETLSMLVKRPAEVVIIDAAVALPYGAAFLARMRRTWPRTASIVVGASGPQLTAEAVNAGARGVFGTGEEADELVSALVCTMLANWPREPVVPSPRPVESIYGLPLTARELEVLRAMSDGLGNAEIGRLLFLSEDTVKTHARRLYRKLGARDRAHAVATAFRTGLIT
ncbi:helix-turn-helix transcriptional regulator [Glycomyces paridis]|uniref:Response regulator transcription factor n=1 Tax=Glycomyces paridis TaxID=2126555 RepID=A0A4S8PA20_9ACTN|nr:response regulator transcription factor [Glycomyces paridis]